MRAQEFGKQGELDVPPSKAMQFCTSCFGMPQELLAAAGVTHVQPWRKVGKSWQPSEIVHARGFFPCLDDFSLAWRKFLQTFRLPRFASGLGRNTGNFSTEEGKKWLEISMSWDAEAWL